MCAAALLAGAGCVAALVWALYVRGAFLPGWCEWQEGTWAFDLDGDGTVEELSLEGRRARVFRAGQLVWESEPAWLVSHALAGDIDGDGTRELVLVCWRRGLYGRSRPFWVERNDTRFSQHVFIGRLEGDGVRHLWMSSETGVDVASASLDDHARLKLVDRSGWTTLWEWQGWGLTLVAEADAEEALVAPEPPLRQGARQATEMNEPQAGGFVSLLVVGDCICHEATLDSCYDAAANEFDFAPVFARVAPWVRGFDVAVATQETPLVGAELPAASFPLFATPDAWGTALADAGFDVVALATNHALDQGTGGLERTLAFWHENEPQVTTLGAYEAPEESHVAYVEAEGVRIAFVDATYGTNGQALPAGEAWRLDLIGDGSGQVRRVREAREAADLVVCVLHVGEEYELEPTEEQRALELRLAEAGADVVACSHTHTLQGAETIHTDEGRACVVFHGLGNFVAAQRDARTVLGGAAVLEVSRGEGGTWGVSSWELEGVVSHVAAGECCVYRLCDYTDDLAASHVLTVRGENPVSVAELEGWLEDATSPTS